MWQGKLRKTEVVNFKISNYIEYTVLFKASTISKTGISPINFKLRSIGLLRKWCFCILSSPFILFPALTRATSFLLAFLFFPLEYSTTIIWISIYLYGIKDRLRLYLYNEAEYKVSERSFLVQNSEKIVNVFMV